MAPSATLRKCCNCEQLTKDRCSFRLQASDPICDRPICYQCKILIFRMRTNDPYRCDVHRIIRTPLHKQVQNNKLSVAGTNVPGDGDAAKGGNEEEEDGKEKPSTKVVIKKRLQKLPKANTVPSCLCSVCSRNVTDIGCDCITSGNGSQPKMCLAPICNECRFRLNGSVLIAKCAMHKNDTNSKPPTPLMDGSDDSSTNCDEVEDSEEDIPQAAFRNKTLARSSSRTDRSNSGAGIDSDEEIIVPDNRSKTSKKSNGRTDRNNNRARRLKAKSTGGSTGPAVSLLQAENDYYLSKGVAFDFDSPLCKSIITSFRVSFATRHLVMNHLVGDVVRRSTVRGGRAGQVLYDVAWRFSAYGETTLANSYVSEGMETYKQLGLDISQSNTQTPSKQRILTDPFLTSGIKRIVETSLEEETCHLSAVSSESDSSDSDADVLGVQSHLDLLSAFQKDNAYIPELLGDSDDDNETNVATLDGLEWNPSGTLQPKASRSVGVETTVLPEWRKYFETPLSSLFAFMPINVWKKVTFECNRYARQKRASTGGLISGYQWIKDITFTEMLQFHGLLFAMVLQPLPGRSYRYYWTQQNTYPWVQCMTLRRFIQIRSVLHFSSNEDEEGLRVDPLHKIRPVYASIQAVIGRYVSLGSEWSLDEASAACRSSFGRHLIVYNPTKNCGKFHFRFYLLCCATTYACIKLRIHVKTDDMVPEDSFALNVEPSLEEARDETSVLNQLVLHMTSPLHQTGHTVNFNNYYASPAVLIQLLQRGVFGRGTVRLNRKFLPKYVMFTKAEARRPNARGSSKVAVNAKFGLVAAGWLDGNPVHIISSADTERISEVRRKVGGKRITVTAPEAIQNYNRGMDGVDRHDQYRSKFSMCKYHGFKKYYVKLYLSLLDMCVTNALLHYKIVHGSEAGCGAEFIASIANILMSPTNEYADHCPELRTAADAVNALGTNEDIHQLFHHTTGATATSIITKGETTKCLYHSLASYNFEKRSKQNTCQICSYERRAEQRWKNVLVCRLHRVRACGVQRPPREKNLLMKGSKTPVQDYSWILGDTGELTCMEKFHTLYLPRGLFSKNIPDDCTIATTTNDQGETQTRRKFKFCKILRHSDLYRQRAIALGLSTNVGGRKHGSKNKKGINRRQDESSSDSNNDSDESMPLLSNDRNERKRRISGDTLGSGPYHSAAEDDDEGYNTDDLYG